VRGLAVAYLSALARLYLRRRRPVIVAIAGNRGKTVLKRILLGLLERRFSVRANPRSYNTEIGLPLAVLGLEIDPRRWSRIAAALLKATGRALAGRPAVEFLVLELGTRQRGDMMALLRTVRPDWAIVTPLAGEAAQEAWEVGVLQSEIADLFARVRADRLILAADDPVLAAATPRGIPAAQLLRHSSLRPVPGGHEFAGASGAYSLGMDIVGESARLAFQAAIVLGERLGMEAATIQAFLTAETGAAGAAPPAGRAAAG
jgi:UDP-N-acetylmuramyl pentapeptide synthase